MPDLKRLMGIPRQATLDLYSIETFSVRSRCCMRQFRWNLVFAASSGAVYDESVSILIPSCKASERLRTTSKLKHPLRNEAIDTGRALLGGEPRR